MTTQVQEMDDGYANGDTQQVISLPAVALTTEPEVTVADLPAQEVAPQATVSVYIDSFSPVTYEPNNQNAAFDLVFSVSSYGEGSNENYKVVKRISVDRQALLAQARSANPVSVVEEKKAEPNRRLLELAGLK